MGWLDFLTEERARSEGPSDWSRADKADYLAKMSAVAASIEEKGNESIHTGLIDRLAKKIQRTVIEF